MSAAPNSDKNPDLDIKLGHHDELVIQDRYEVISIGNDVLIGLWFLVGSFLFFSDSTIVVGTWLFVIGSIQMLIRPAIRLRRRVHLQRVRRSGRVVPADF